MPAGRPSYLSCLSSLRLSSLCLPSPRQPLAAVAAAAALGAAVMLPAAPAAAQPAPVTAGTPVRVIPQDALQARLEMGTPNAGQPLTAKLDGKAFAVAPGLRLFSTDTTLLTAASIAGKKLPVRYKLDLYGQLQTAWVMTEPELKAWKESHAK